MGLVLRAMWNQNMYVIPLFVQMHTKLIILNDVIQQPHPPSRHQAGLFGRSILKNLAAFAIAHARFSPDAGKSERTKSQRKLRRIWSLLRLLPRLRTASVRRS